MSLKSINIGTCGSLTGVYALARQYEKTKLAVEQKYPESMTKLKLIKGRIDRNYSGFMFVLAVLAGQGDVFRHVSKIKIGSNSSKYIRKIEMKKKRKTMESFTRAKEAFSDFMEIKSYLHSTEEYKAFSAAKKALKAAVRQDLEEEDSYDQMLAKIKVERLIPLQEETKSKIQNIPLMND
jgi:hypothetical protein